jgi:hypothetical protein
MRQMHHEWPSAADTSAAYSRGRPNDTPENAMRFPPNSFKHRAHALIQQLPDNANWRDLIDSAIERIDLDAESGAADAPTANVPAVADDPSAEYDA